MSPVTRATLAQTSRVLNVRVARGFATSGASRAQNQNQIYASVRRPDDFHTYQLLSSSARTPLLTLWTTSWCSTCRVVTPLIRSLVEAGVGEQEGGVAFCTIEYDAPDIMSGADGLGMTYMITAIPTLLSFDAGEAMTQTKVTDGRKLADRAFLEEWIRNEARRHGGRGGGGTGVFGGLFGGLRG
ncbi:hypothetical protein E0Z10_g5444 [Xylaria hypoxylon]|uniref:Thioredoxin domain-containing protein n=1 Tax=Xylaria hypoxylon TaxID=37992 RepID=A0A4Z0Z3S7_9PEZI|nr:hypothetical protein E0Z10_g5444 [Xylaria hypoxylon]